MTDTATSAPTAPAVGDTTSVRRLLLQPASLVVLLVGVALRVWVLLSPQGWMNADEAYTGLQAADVTRGHLPIVIGGAAYTGTIDALLLAPFIALLGQHVLIVKLMSPILWALVAALTVGCARRIVSDRAALLAGAMVWLAPGALMVLSTRGYVAYASGFGLVVAFMWSAFALLALDAPRVKESAVTGALAGLAFYTHPMFTAVVAPVAVVIAVKHRRRGREFWLPALSAAVAVNVPFLLWNARNSWRSLEQPPNDSGATYAERFRGFFVDLLPRDLGMRRITDGGWVMGRPVAAVVTLGVLVAAGYGAYRIGRVDRWRGAALAAPLIAAWPLMALLTNLSFVDDGRYGIIVFPILVLCLVAAIDPLLRPAPRPTWTLLAAAWVLLLTLPFLKQDAGTALSDPNRPTQALIDTLEAEGFDRVAGNYAAVLPIEFQSGGRIRAAVAGNPYVIRLPHTQRLVDATPADRLAYVFAPGPIGPTWVKLPVEQYRQVPVAGWVVYFPPED